MRGLTFFIIGVMCSSSFAQDATPVSAPVPVVAPVVAPVVEPVVAPVVEPVVAPAAKFTVSARLELLEAAKRAAVRCDKGSDSEVLVQLVPLYRGDYPSAAALGEVSPVLGPHAVRMYQAAASETDKQVRAVKEEVTRDLLSAFTLVTLGQNQLHVAGYAALVESASKLGPVEVEIVTQERLRDEASIERLANPSMWQALGWWWNQ